MFKAYFTTPPSFTEKDAPDLEGKVFIITGGTGGVGLELAKILYHANASKIYLLGRSESAGKAAINEVLSAAPAPDVPRRQTPGLETVIFLHLDLSDLSSVRKAANSFLQVETRLDVIWHNAAIMLAPQESLSKQGHELTFATNVLGPFLLQHFLTPILITTAADHGQSQGSVRTCWAGSGSAVAPPGEDGIVWENWALQGPGYAGFSARTARYMQSKACNAILAAEMARRYHQFTSVAFNPGNLKTEIARHAPGFLARLHYLTAHPARFGALTELYAGFDAGVAKANGCFVVPFGKIGNTVLKVEQGIKLRNSGERLWELCEGLVKDFY